MTTSKKTTKYSPAMVAAIVSAFEAKGFMDSASCAAVLKTEAFAGSDITHRGVIAKVRSMNLKYEKAEKVTKAGEPVATKEAIVAEIENALGVSGLSSLAKAEKKALRTLLSVVTGSEDLEADETVAA
jgi:citrate lyase beta subunit